ncbi:hypothetical protein Pure05_06550 [Paenarthrobacter ureafaciens]|nr:hypothetical protein Pure02_06580 [Paenarthrobacter ureafaciens]GLU66682.1 hypothetical protein Pure03_06580 [Paenarthrobacter ureafaciens]GLU70594.1 hypothetical protein Pure04_03090 [Paenarthrobacter ureafaciens]GLU75215.1 hypothetical protein Pure05_06550 [Paenarthrobacter ureafaciens]
MLHGTGPRRLDIAGERQRACPKVQGRDRGRRLGNQVNHVAYPAEVLIEDLIGMGKVHVRLFGAANAQDVASRYQWIGIDRGVLAGGAKEP